MIRDGEAGFYLSSVLFKHFEMGGILPNFSPAFFGTAGPMLKDYHFFRDGDLIFSPTRLGLNDRGRKQVKASGLPLEMLIFQYAQPFFTCLSRSEVVLSKKVTACIPETHPNRDFRAVQFYTKNNATYLRKADTDSRRELLKGAKILGHYRTVCYLLYIPRLKHEELKGYPGFLNCFGLNGPATLLWGKYLATEGSSLLEEVIASSSPRLVVAELQLPDDQSWILPPLLQELPPMPVTIHFNLAIPTEEL